MNALEPCPYCGAPGVGGYEGCRAAMNELTALAFSNALCSRSHRLVVDCYALQHPETFCVSAKSYAAHLTGVCVALEYGDRVQVNAAVQRWLNGTPLTTAGSKTKLMEKPSVPQFRGSLTVLHLQDARDNAECEQRVRAWAVDIWEAYGKETRADLHRIAREYIEQALANARPTPERHP